LIAGSASCAVEPDDGSATDTGETTDSVTSTTPSQDQAIESPDPLTDDTAVPEVLSDCPSGWFCLWQDAGFAGRRVQFQGTGCQNLTTFGFNSVSMMRCRPGPTRPAELIVFTEISIARTSCSAPPPIRALPRLDSTIRHRQSAAAPVRRALLFQFYIRLSQRFCPRSAHSGAQACHRLRR
jgi:hypothetical protein